MSSKVRIIYRNPQGGYRFGHRAVTEIKDVARHGGLVLPKDLQEKAAWVKVKWYFQHLPDNAVRQLWIWRESPKLKTRFSEYRKMCSSLGLTLATPSRQNRLTSNLRELGEQAARLSRSTKAEEPRPVSLFGRTTITTPSRQTRIRMPVVPPVAPANGEMTTPPVRDEQMLTNLLFRDWDNSPQDEE